VKGTAEGEEAAKLENKRERRKKREAGEETGIISERNEMRVSKRLCHCYLNRIEQK
jgi:hypothetical protein